MIPSQLNLGTLWAVPAGAKLHKKERRIVLGFPASAVLEVIRRRELENEHEERASSKGNHTWRTILDKHEEHIIDMGSCQSRDDSWNTLRVQTNFHCRRLGMNG